MAELTPDIADDVLAACKANADEAAEAFGRALDVQVTLSFGQLGVADMQALPEELDGPGLAIVLTVGTTGALLVLPEISGLLPQWYADPDPTGQSKLTTLAQELGMLVLPEQLMPDDFKAARVKNLAGAVRRGGVSDGAAMVSLELSAGQKQGIVSLIWPAPKPAAVIGSAPAQPKPKSKPQPESKPQPQPKPQPEAEQPPAPRMRRRTRIADLPNYSRSLLRIKVPVVVTLAEKRQPLGRIVELGPGSIIQFDKSCEEMLEMDVGGRRVAIGEAIKVGDKFGLRITSIILPEERFHPVRPQ